MSNEFSNHISILKLNGTDIQNRTKSGKLYYSTRIFQPLDLKLMAKYNFGGELSSFPQTGVQSYITVLSEVPMCTLSLSSRICSQRKHTLAPTSKGGSFIIFSTPSTKILPVIIILLVSNGQNVCNEI